eukprot:2825726-Pleurochrysis_carterae.AAC.1
MALALVLVLALALVQALVLARERRLGRTHLAWRHAAASSSEWLAEQTVPVQLASGAPELYAEALVGGLLQRLLEFAREALVHGLHVRLALLSNLADEARLLQVLLAVGLDAPHGLLLALDDGLLYR